MQQTLMVFPCDFSIKIIGNARADFLVEITKIVCKHFPDTQNSAFTTQHSEQGNYQSITAVVHVLDQPSLDALYQELTQHSDVRMVL